ncbi:glycosyltransferase family 9 protein [Fluviispira sanaruensis]|nr:glycosyltransferase family 9 protein [Fluviispira sanaruensis]
MKRYICQYHNPHLERIGRIFDFIFLKLMFKKNLKDLHEELFSKILIFESHLIGDCVMTTALIKNIRNQYPYAQIDILSNSWMLQIVNPEVINNIYSVNVPWSRYNYSIKNIFHFFFTIIKLRKKNYDLAIETRGEIRNNFVLFLTAAKRRLGIDMAGGTFLLTDSITLDLKPTLAEKRMFLLKKLGITYEEFMPDIFIPKNDLIKVTQFLSENKIFENDYILFHPGGSNPQKSFLVNEIIDLRKRFSNYNFVIAYGPNERETIKLLSQELKPQIYNGKTLFFSNTISAFAEMARKSLVTITMESGPAHISSALEAKCFVIFAHDKPDYVKPLGKRVTMVDFENLDILESLIKNSH